MTQQHSSASTTDTVNRFNEAFNQGDVDAIMAAMTEDCLFEDTSPPDGRRHKGQAAVRAVWQEFFASTRDPAFVVEEMFSSGDRAVVRWTFSWTDQHGQKGHVRGVDIFRVSNGKVVEKLSYVKG